MNHPTLSVLMPNYNHSRYLADAITAIATQSLRPVEFIIVDDCSTDNSAEIIQSLSGKYDFIRFIRNEKNKGALQNAIMLLDIAEGEYVYFAAADDLVLPGFLEKCMGLLGKYPQAALCACQSLYIDEHGNNKGIFPGQIKTRMEFISPEYFARTLNPRTARLHDEWFMGNTTIYRKKELVDAGGFNEAMGSYTDGFISHILAIKHGACYLSEPLACWRILDTGISRTTLSNQDVRAEIISNAVREMLTNHASIFPRDYVEEWARRQKWNTARMVWRKSLHQNIHGIREKHPASQFPAKAYIHILILFSLMKSCISFLLLASGSGGAARRWMWRKFISILKRDN